MLTAYQPRAVTHIRIPKLGNPEKLIKIGVCIILGTEVGDSFKVKFWNMKGRGKTVHQAKKCTHFIPCPLYSVMQLTFP